MGGGVSADTSSMGTGQSEIRDEMKLILANLDDRWLKAANAEICDRLRELLNGPGRSIEHVLLFQPLGHGTVDLKSLMLEQEQEGRRMYIPCDINGSGFYELSATLIQELGEFDFDNIHCSKLVEAPFLADDAVDTLVVIPGLAFDNFGNRIGWGSLNYEKLMSRPGMGKARTCGVCWSLQIVEQVPVRSTDLLVDWVIHERELIKTSIGALS